MNAALVQSLEQTGIHVTPYFWQKVRFNLVIALKLMAWSWYFVSNKGDHYCTPQTCESEFGVE